VPGGSVAAGHLGVGPDEHGAVPFGRSVIAGLRARGPVGTVVETTAADLLRDLDGTLAPLSGLPLVHVQYTDRLFGVRCEDSATLFAAVSAALASRGGRLSATLHDLPVAPGETTASADDPLVRRRSAVYGRVARACSGLVVSSRHEHGRLTALGTGLPPVVVIPLPVDLATDRPPDPRPAGDVAVLGFLYPGKGHDEVLRALDCLPPGVSMTALGRPSDGHADLITDLRCLAGSLGRTFRMTGFVPDHALVPTLREAGIPVAPHRTISASGSIASWLGAGRRPLAPDVPYTRELEQRCPGALWLYGDGDLPSLAEALRAAFDHPDRTWLGEIAVGPSTAEVAAAYDVALTRWS